MNDAIVSGCLPGRGSASPVTWESLSRLRDLRAEAVELEERRDEYQRAIDEIAGTTDVVTSSRRQFPYEKQTITIRGIAVNTRDQTECAARRRELMAVNFRLAEKRDEVFVALCTLESFINDLPDSHFRRMFRLYFADGLTWQQVANRMGGGNTADGCRIACKRYVDKNRACPLCSA